MSKTFKLNILVLLFFFLSEQFAFLLFKLSKLLKGRSQASLFRNLALRILFKTSNSICVGLENLMHLCFFIENQINSLLGALHQQSFESNNQLSKDDIEQKFSDGVVIEKQQFIKSKLSSYICFFRDKTFFFEPC